MGTSHSRRGGILFALSLAALIVFCLLAAAGLFLVRDVTIRNGIAIDTPAGSIDIHPHAGSDTSIAGVPAYPGARSRRKGGGAVVEWFSNDGRHDKGLAVAEAVTPDPMDQVVAYYRRRLPDWRVEYKDNAVVFETDEDGAKRFVGVSRKNDGTHIGVASVGGAAGN